MTRRLVAPTLGVLLLAAACGQSGEADGGGTLPASSPSSTTAPATTTTSPAALLDEIRWVVTGLTVDGARVDVPAGSGLFLVFDVGVAAVAGSGGCNGFGGKVEIAGSGLFITDVVSTLIGCQPDVADRETSFFDALGKVEVFALDGDTLALSSADRSTSISLTVEAPPADQNLEGTEWHLVSIGDGDSASSMLAGTDPTLVIDQNRGTVGGSAGCNSYGGAVVIGAETITISDLYSTKMACGKDEVTSQELSILDILGRAATWSVDGDRLLIAADDGRSLEYQAG